MPRNFLINFSEKEGTTAFVQFLDKFDGIEIPHYGVRNLGWEPFDRHECGEMALDDFRFCLDGLWGDGAVSMSDINARYLKSATKYGLPLRNVDRTKSVGFKMRFYPHNKDLLYVRFLAKLGLMQKDRDYWKTIFDLFKAHDVLLVMAVRVDVLRWALSKYHGDGTGRKGHLQFSSAQERAIASKSKIHVNLMRFQKILDECNAVYEKKKAVMRLFQNNGIDVYEYHYEDFLYNKRDCLECLLRKLGVDVTNEEMTIILNKETPQKKVHSSDISEFICNSDQVMEYYERNRVQW